VLGCCYQIAQKQSHHNTSNLWFISETKRLLASLRVDCLTIRDEPHLTYNTICIELSCFTASRFSALIWINNEQMTMVLIFDGHSSFGKGTEFDPEMSSSHSSQTVNRGVSATRRLNEELLRRRAHLHQSEIEHSFLESRGEHTLFEV
jgi:hypothetical protein